MYIQKVYTRECGTQVKARVTVLPLAITNIECKAVCVHEAWFKRKDGSTWIRTRNVETNQITGKPWVSTKELHDMQVELWEALKPDVVELKARY